MNTLLSDLNLLLATRRWCYAIIATQDPSRTGGYVPSLVIENHAGHYPLRGRGDGAAPWIFGQTLAEAQATCRTVNREKFGYDEETTFRIECSTFRKKGAPSTASAQPRPELTPIASGAATTTHLNPFPA